VPEATLEATLEVMPEVGGLRIVTYVSGCALIVGTGILFERLDCGYWDTIRTVLPRGLRAQTVMEAGAPWVV